MVKYRHFRAYATSFDGFNVRHYTMSYLATDLKDCYKHFLHFVKDNCFYNLRYLTIYEVLENGYEKRSFWFDTLTPNTIYLVSNTNTIAIR